MKRMSNIPYFPGVAWYSLILAAVCLAFLAVGNILYHSQILPMTEITELKLARFISQEDGSVSSPLSLAAIALASKWDIICLLLVSFSRLTKIPGAFISSVLSCRSIAFGFCGAYIVGMIPHAASSLHGCLMWIVFFLYHIAYFSVLICFSAETLQANSRPTSMVKNIRYLISILAECSLIIFFNLIYYFLINKIKS